MDKYNAVSSVEVAHLITVVISTVSKVLLLNLFKWQLTFWGLFRPRGQQSGFIYIYESKTFIKSMTFKFFCTLRVTAKTSRCTLSVFDFRRLRPEVSRMN